MLTVICSLYTVRHNVFFNVAWAIAQINKSAHKKAELQ